MINGHRVFLVAACDAERGIGKDGTLPWRLKKELAYFHRVTSQAPAGKQNMVVMGRSTWLSIPEHRRPLPGRKNVVLSRQSDFVAPGAVVVHSLAAAYTEVDDSIADIHIIGGGRVFEEVVAAPEVDGIYLTEIAGSFACDTFFPEIPGDFHRRMLGQESEGDISYEYCLYERSR